MKQITLLTLILFLSSMTYAQSGRINGYWMTEDDESQIEIFTDDRGEVHGKIIWLDEPYEEDGSPKLDGENPEPDLRRQPILGLEIIKGFTYDASDEEWSGGSIYDPESGRTYTAYMRLEDRNTLRLRGYVMGMRFLGRTTYWTRADGPLE